jgi:cyclic dehypoxanthinyl futalosine synthase
VVRNPRLERIKEKVFSGERITPEEGVYLLKNAETLELGMLANFVRSRLHPGRIVTFVIDRNINYTNVCVCKCKFCAFHVSPNSKNAYVISLEELESKIKETVSLGGTAILFQGGLHPELDITFFERILKFIKTEFPQIHIHGFSAPEVFHISKVSGISVEETLKRLINAGLGSLPGGGAEILSNRVRKEISPNKITKEQWLEVHEIAHRLGIKTTATMMFGSVETEEEIIEHLESVRSLQDRTGGFTAFIPWSFQPKNTALSSVRKKGAERYLRVLALSRIYLDNIPNVQSSWVTQGGKVAQVSLKFGANDFGSLMIEENVVAAAGVRYRLPLAEIVRLIKDAGYQPVQRDTLYRPVRIFD